MATLYELKLPTHSASIIKEINGLLDSISSSGEIDILSKSTDEVSFLNAQFRFHKWRDLAETRYLQTNNFRPAIPTITPNAKELANNVRSQLFDAAECELVASQLIVTIKADLGEITFLAEYPDLMIKNQEIMVATYLQQRLDLLFKSLSENYKLPPIKVIRGEEA